MENQTSNIIYAAGGLVWKDSPDGKKIAVVYRKKYDDWSLPKGKMDESDKNLEQTALREVREETGIDAAITGLAGCVHYPVRGKTKFVIFYYMSANTGTAGSLHKDVQKCRWLSVAEAYKKLTYSREKELLKTSLPADLKPHDTGNRTSKLRRSSSLRQQRLIASIASLREDLIHRTEADNKNSRPHPWRVKLAFQMLDMSERCISNGNKYLNQAWKYFHHAHQMSLWTLDPDELRSFSTSLKIETSKKLSGSWRGKAVEKLLSGNDTADQIPPTENIAEAAKIRDENSDNQYYKIEMIGLQIKYLFPVLGVNLILLFIIFYWWSRSVNGLLLTNPIPEITYVFIILIFLFGALGGILTTLVSLVRSGAGGTIPDYFLDWKMTIARPGLGGAAAIVIFIGTNAGIPGLSADTIGSAFFLAVASGFTERILIGALIK